MNENQALEVRLQRIEKKLDERVVYRDVYEAEKNAIRQAIAHAMATTDRETKAAAGLLTESIDNVNERAKERDTVLDKRLASLEGWRTTVYALIATNLVGLIIGLVMFLLNRQVGL